MCVCAAIPVGREPFVRASLCWGPVTPTPRGTVGCRSCERACVCLLAQPPLWVRFPTWRLQQEEGFNLLLYGFGSKQDLLQDYLVYCCRADPDTAVVVTNGAVPTCTIKSIADAITKRIVGTTIRFSSLLEHCRFIAIQMGGGDGVEGVVGSSGGGGGGGGGSGWVRQDAASLPRVLLAIHNIDGPALRSPEAQTALRLVVLRVWPPARLTPLPTPTPVLGPRDVCVRFSFEFGWSGGSACV